MCVGCETVMIFRNREIVAHTVNSDLSVTFSSVVADDPNPPKRDSNGLIIPPKNWKTKMCSRFINNKL